MLKGWETPELGEEKPNLSKCLPFPPVAPHLMTWTPVHEVATDRTDSSIIFAQPNMPSTRETPVSREKCPDPGVSCVLSSVSALMNATRLPLQLLVAMPLPTSVR